jgi:hypothetical protein
MIENVWDRKYNMKNKPTVTNRTAEAINKVMEKHNCTIGMAIEKLIKQDEDYESIIKELRTDYKDI